VATSPSPETQRSAIEANPIVELRAELAKLSRELEAERRLRRVSAAPKGTVPPPSSSKSWRKAWAPSAVAGAIATVLGAWYGLTGGFKPDPPPEPQRERWGQEHRETREKLQRLNDTVSAFLVSESDRRKFEDAVFCELGALPPGGCPHVRMLPRPMSNSGARQIQPAVTVQPLPEAPE